MLPSTEGAPAISIAPACLAFPFWDVRPEAAVRRAFWIFAAALLGFRWLVLATLPIDLSGDEACYWEWGRQLGWGYATKPPGIAWLMALASWVGGDTTFGIRMFAALLGTGSLIFVFHLALRLYGPAVAMITAIAFVANPANAALNLVLTIDAPLMFFWTLSLWAFWEFTHAEPAPEDGSRQRRLFRRARIRWGAVLFLGLVGGLLSKQMMLTFLPLAVAFLALSRDRRAQLRRPATWLVLLAPLIAWLPPLWWNAQHQWITLRHTMHHFEGGSASIGRQVVRFVEHLGAQSGIITPVLYLLLMALVFAAWWSWKGLGDRERFLWLFGGPALLVILFLSLRQRIQPNWPAVFYVSTGILLTGWAAGKWSLERKLDQWRRAFAPGLKVAMAFALVVHVVVFALSFGLLRLPGLDPTARLRGWSQLARDVDAVRRDLPGGMDMILITQSHRYLTSELAFYLHDQPRVYSSTSAPDTIGSPHVLESASASARSKDALIIIQGDPPSIRPELKTRFESVTVHSILRYPGQSSALRTVTLAIGRDLR